MHPVHEQVLRFIDDPAAGTFEEIALAVFAHQFDAIEPYRRFCEQRGRTPASVGAWNEIPPVPIEAFKQAELCCAPPERVFLSTGTTRGTERRSRHCMPDLRLYHRSALGGLRRFLFPDQERMRIVSLIAPAAERPQSSLSQMVTWAAEAFGTPRSEHLDGETGAGLEQLFALCREAERSGELLCVMATTAALIRALDRAREAGLSFRLPHGSRLMDTGGDKGAPRRLSRNGLLHAVWSTFAIPGYFVVNEYGMCELSSQFYDNVVAERRAGRFRARYKSGPPWLRTLVLDPETLAPAPPGERGLLCHFDLANAASAMAVLSEDVGRRIEDGFEILGRAAGAEARGCSMSLAEWERGRHVPA